MKKFLQILSLFIFIGCASTSKNITTKQNTQGLENQNFKIEKVIFEGKTYMNFNTQESPNISFEKNKFYGYTGCNRFFGTYENNGENLNISNDYLASTKMLCYPKEIMDFEYIFLTNLKGTFKIIKNKQIILENEEMQIFLK